ncbi:MAG: hypothetical protein ABEH61_01020 [Haloarculaceae archaeon]
MGLFNRLGRKVEQIKREAESASEGTATHGCEECGTLLYSDFEACPECGEAAVTAIDAE